MANRSSSSDAAAAASASCSAHAAIQWSATDHTARCARCSVRREGLSHLRFRVRLEEHVAWAGDNCVEEAFACTQTGGDTAHAEQIAASGHNVKLNALLPGYQSGALEDQALAFAELLVQYRPHRPNEGEVGALNRLSDAPLPRAAARARIAVEIETHLGVGEADEERAVLQPELPSWCSVVTDQLDWHHFAGKGRSKRDDGL
mmetsp:Transcript_7027/g.17995  ORF Transcript_7027/g.17995 Transcript_7027/m.17995 type:complete len:203 (+) Transcript_7027:142-750(+)